MAKLSDIVPQGAIVASLKSADREAVIAELITALAAAGIVDPAIQDEVTAKVLDRERRGSTGFGYDPMFLPEGHALTYGEMPPAEKHAISHRARAFAQLSAACLG